MWHRHVELPHYAGLIDSVTAHLGPDWGDEQKSGVSNTLEKIYEIQSRFVDRTGHDIADFLSKLDSAQWSCLDRFLKSRRLEELEQWNDDDITLSAKHYEKWKDQLEDLVGDLNGSQGDQLKALLKTDWAKEKAWAQKRHSAADRFFIGVRQNRGADVEGWVKVAMTKSEGLYEFSDQKVWRERRERFQTRLTGALDLLTRDQRQKLRVALQEWAADFRSWSMEH